MDTNENDGFGFPLSLKCRQENLSACCESLLKQNQKLEKLLEREKQKRRKVENAFKKLLVAYNSIVDVNKIYDESASSNESNSDYSDKETDLNNENCFIAKDSFNNKIALSANPSIPQLESILKRPLVEAANWKKKPPPVLNTIFCNKISAVQPNRHSSSALSLLSNVENRLLSSTLNVQNVSSECLNRLEFSKINEQIEKEKNPTKFRNCQRKVMKEINEDRNKEFPSRPHYNVQIHNQQTNPKWYFLALDDEDSAQRKEAIRRSRVDSWLQQSAERKRAIASTSQRRAVIASNRRAMVVDILQGRRQLDDEALRILHTDSSTISSFPDLFMRKMRLSSRKKYLESQKRFERERGNYHEKQFQIATNKILAHTSATIAKGVLGAKKSFDLATRKF